MCNGGGGKSKRCQGGDWRRSEPDARRTTLSVRLWEDHSMSKYLLYSVLQAYNPNRSHRWDATLSRRNLWPRCFHSEVFRGEGLFSFLQAASGQKHLAEDPIMRNFKIQLRRRWIFYFPFPQTAWSKHLAKDRVTNFHFKLQNPTQEAVDIANDCRTGLASYFYSGDVAQCWRVSRDMLELMNLMEVFLRWQLVSNVCKSLKVNYYDRIVKECIIF